MSKIVIDLDGTLTIPDSGHGYASLLPNRKVVDKLVSYREQGFEIAIYTSRNMRTYGNSIGKINAHTLPEIIEWLNKHQIPFDEIHVGKPWCGPDGFHVDDRSIRPDEFERLTLEEIRQLTSPAARP